MKCMIQKSLLVPLNFQNDKQIRKQNTKHLPHSSDKIISYHSCAWGFGLSSSYRV